MYIFYNGYPLRVLGTAVIRGRVAWEVNKTTDKAFYHAGAWYVWDRTEK